MAQHMDGLVGHELLGLGRHVDESIIPMQNLISGSFFWSTGLETLEKPDQDVDNVVRIDRTARRYIIGIDHTLIVENGQNHLFVP